MKSLTLIFVAAMLFSTQSIADPIEITSPIEKIFIPNGFDDNDNIEIILFGQFPNTCYKTGQTGFYFDQENKKISVWATAYKYNQENLFCAQVMVPFIQVVKIGLLAEGQYEVQLVTQQGIKRQFNVYKSVAESPDEFIYAPVSAVTAEFDRTTNKQSVAISGYFPRLYTGCMKLVDVRMEMDPEDVLVIRPIAEIFPDNECFGAEYKFNLEKELPFILPNNTLIHTRVTNGNSLNQIVADPSKE